MNAHMPKLLEEIFKWRAELYARYCVLQVTNDGAVFIDEARRDYVSYELVCDWVMREMMYSLGTQVGELTREECLFSLAVAAAMMIIRFGVRFPYVDAYYPTKYQMGLTGPTDGDAMQLWNPSL